MTVKGAWLSITLRRELRDPVIGDSDKLKSCYFPYPPLRSCTNRPDQRFWKVPRLKLSPLCPIIGFLRVFIRNIVEKKIKRPTILLATKRGKSYGNQYTPIWFVRDIQNSYHPLLSISITIVLFFGGGVLQLEVQVFKPSPGSVHIINHTFFIQSRYRALFCVSRGYQARHNTMCWMRVYFVCEDMLYNPSRKSGELWQNCGSYMYHTSSLYAHAHAFFSRVVRPL